MSQFGVSRTTVRRALQDLVAAGVIDRQAGRGTFVRKPILQQELTRLTGFVEDMETLGLRPSAQVITIERVFADGPVSQALDIDLGAECLHIERIRLANNEPVSFDDSYLPLDVGQAVASEDLATNPFYSILEQRQGIPLGEADYTLQATVAGARLAGLLNVEEGDPLLLIERTTYARDGGRALLHEFLHYRGDRIRYRLKLKR